MDGESQKREIGFKEIRKKWNLILFKAALQIVAELDTGARGQSCLKRIGSWGIVTAGRGADPAAAAGLKNIF